MSEQTMPVDLIYDLWQAEEAEARAEAAALCRDRAYQGGTPCNSLCGYCRERAGLPPALEPSQSDALLAHLALIDADLAYVQRWATLDGAETASLSSARRRVQLLQAGILAGTLQPVPSR